MECPHCGKGNSNKAKFCSNCGNGMKEKKSVTRKIVVTPLQRVYCFAEFRMKDLERQRSHLNERLSDSTDEGWMTKILGGVKGKKMIEEKIDWIDQRIDDLLTIRTTLGGA